VVGGERDEASGQSTSGEVENHPEKYVFSRLALQVMGTAEIAPL